MKDMFWVRSARAWNRCLYGPSPCMPLVAAAPRPRASQPAHLAPRFFAYAFLLIRQEARAFNESLSFDTSKVTTMESMFEVRSAHTCGSPTFTQPLVGAHSEYMPLGPPPHARLSASPHLAPRLAYASLVTRQYASAFNQPLSFDTSEVTDMDSMFRVRSARA